MKYQWLKKDAAIDDSDDEDVKFEENPNEFKNENLNYDYENVRDVSEDESDKGLSDEQDSSEGLSGSDDYFWECDQVIIGNWLWKAMIIFVYFPTPSFMARFIPLFIAFLCDKWFW